MANLNIAEQLNNLNLHPLPSINQAHFRGLMNLSTPMSYQSGWNFYAKYRKQCLRLHINWDVHVNNSVVLQEIENWLIQYYQEPVWKGIPKKIV